MDWVDIVSLIDTFSKEALEEIVRDSHSYNEVADKVGYSSKSGDLYTMIKNKIIEYGISIEHFGYSGRMQRSPENIFIENSTADQSTVRKWYMNGQYSEYKCAICGQEPFWNNKDLSLTLDHINGKNHDDRIDNLRWVCPNCDRQLDTFGGRNRSPQEKRKQYCTSCGKEISLGAKVCKNCYAETPRQTNCPEKAELISCIINNNGNFRTVGGIYGVSDNAVRKWCKKYGMSCHSLDYRKQINSTLLHN